MIGAKTRGSFRKTLKALETLKSGDIFSSLERYGVMGMDALSNATPVDSGLAARSWGYRVRTSRGRYILEWYNTNIENGIQVVILIQYGHGTGTGGYVQGRDFINPAIRPIFDKIADDVWEKVKNA
jgi:hypothetical protein